ncbi:MAG: hypothetical protein L3J82_02925 [Planctomycetes bacterium]|nr:hypothetical protein [Planctomycetota bacterium]
MNLNISKTAVFGAAIFAFGAMVSPEVFAQEGGGPSLGAKLLGIPGGPFGIVTQLSISLTPVFLVG